MKKNFRIQFFPKKSRFNFSRKNPDLIFPEKNSRNFPGKNHLRKRKKTEKKFQLFSRKKKSIHFPGKSTIFLRKGEKREKKNLPKKCS